MVFGAVFYSCNNDKKSKQDEVNKIVTEVYAKEPNDSSSYTHLKYDFYISKTGKLCERKLASAKGTNCNCLFEVYYDSTYKVYIDDTIIERPLDEIVDIDSFEWIDSSDYSKDKNKVFYFYSNSDGGIRFVIDMADPKSFRRLCEYRWGIDDNYVFYRGDILHGLNIKNLQILYSPDTSDHFVQYVKDDKQVFFCDQVIKGADANTFKVVSGEKWEAVDENYKYESGRRLQ
jgi:hypothetical protein